jgi:hypothetical protein
MSGEYIESGERAGKCLANVSSPGKVVGECRANVSSPTHFPKKSILASTRIRQTGEFLASTQIQQIRRRVAIAYFFHNWIINSTSRNWKRKGHEESNYEESKV